MGSPYMGTMAWLLDEGCEELLDAVTELLLGVVTELPGMLELLGSVPEELGFSADDELGSSVPSSPEQEKVNAIASTMLAVSASFEMVFLMCCLLCWVSIFKLFCRCRCKLFQYNCHLSAPNMMTLSLHFLWNHIRGFHI